MSKYPRTSSYYFSYRIKKLYFLQNLVVFMAMTKMLLVLLYYYFIDTVRKHYGFIPKIVNILYTYYIYDNPILKGSFLRELLLIILKTKNKLMYGFVGNSMDNSFSRYRNTHLSVKVPEFWKRSRASKEIINAYFITQSLITQEALTKFATGHLYMVVSSCGTHSIRYIW